jgi:hypothetical protein
MGYPMGVDPDSLRGTPLGIVGFSIRFGVAVAIGYRLSEFLLLFRGFTRHSCEFLFCV